LDELKDCLIEDAEDDEEDDTMKWKDEFP
jgi:hypothetical protein